MNKKTDRKQALVLEFPSNSFQIFIILASLFFSGPEYLADKTPGAPFKASISKPESSEKQFNPYLYLTKSALILALASRVVPVSSISSLQLISFKPNEY